jgi:flagellar basal body-associated protein FliL
MAEIHVQAKKKTNPAWIWILVGLVIIAAVVFFIMRNNQAKQNDTTNKPPASSQLQVATPYEVMYA